MDDALADGLVKLLRGLLQRGLGSRLVAGDDRSTGLTDDGPQLALDGLVALARLLVGLVALDLRLDVCHVRETFVRVMDGVPRTREGRPAAP
ncbi:hypothetical protein ABE10_02355 [Bacillus toyonensis]|nr:hypothetical protein [Bacillus toyonensis]